MIQYIMMLLDAIAAMVAMVGYAGGVLGNFMGVLISIYNMIAFAFGLPPMLVL